MFVSLTTLHCEIIILLMLLKYQQSALKQYCIFKEIFKQHTNLLLKRMKALHFQHHSEASFIF